MMPAVYAAVADLHCIVRPAVRLNSAEYHLLHYTCAWRKLVPRGFDADSNMERWPHAGVPINVPYTLFFEAKRGYFHKFAFVQDISVPFRCCHLHLAICSQVREANADITMTFLIIHCCWATAHGECCIEIRYVVTAAPYIAYTSEHQMMPVRLYVHYETLRCSLCSDSWF